LCALKLVLRLTKRLRCSDDDLTMLVIAWYSALICISTSFGHCDSTLRFHALTPLCTSTFTCLRGRMHADALKQLVLRILVLAMLGYWLYRLVFCLGIEPFVYVYDNSV
jgi:hypothetical protein